MAGTPDSWLSGLGLSPVRVLCVVFLGKIPSGFVWVLENLESPGNLLYSNKQ